MAFERVRPLQYIADTKEDLKNIKENKIGIECYVIKEACEYKQMSTGEWIKQVPISAGSGNGNIDLSGFATEQYVDNAIANIKFPEVDLSNYSTKEDVDKAIADIDIPSIDHLSTKTEVEAFKEEIKACYRPIKYEIVNVPAGTIIDYRDKEIRIFCPENVEFHRQTDSDNIDIYYATLISYAPKGAVGLREGNKGIILDEYISLESGNGTGIDKFGRKYKKHQLALASYDTKTKTWNYYGNNSTVEKYIGWTYVVAWYDENENMIDTDILRINLSNKDCHLVLENSYIDEEATIWAELPE